MDGRIAFNLGNIPVYAFGLWVALGVLSAFIVMLLCAPQGKRCCVVRCFPAAVLGGLILSRLLFCVTDQSFLNSCGLAEVFSVARGGLSMTGALGGAVLGTYIVCRAQREKTGAMLDALAPALLAFVLFARRAEFGGDELGISRPLRTQWLMGSFLTVDDEYLMVYCLEAATALILLLVVILVLRRRYAGGGVMLGTMLLFGATQVIMESLKHDGHMSISFVGLEHVFSYLILSAALVILALASRKTGKKAVCRTALVSVVPVAGLCVLIEFWLDRTPINRWLLYGAYILLLIYMCAQGFVMLGQYRKSSRGEE